MGNCILYHGSTVEVKSPLVNIGRKELDFGPGFYLTSDKSQAERWALTLAGRNPWLAYDWIEGGIANDSVISTVDAYVDGFINAEQALDRLVYETLRHQVCISRQSIVDRFLSFDSSEIVRI